MSVHIRKTETRINGVSVAALFETVDAIKETSSLGRYQFRARNQWLDGGHTRTIVKDFFGAGSEQTTRSKPFIVESEIPALFGGGDRAMDPLEYLLAALGACVTTMLVWQAAVQGIHVDAIDTWVEGDIDLHGCFGLDQDLPPGYEEIRLTVKLEADASEAELDSLIELGTRYSPLFDTVSRGTRVIVRREGSIPVPLSSGRPARCATGNCGGGFTHK